jgi:hypothetical protein
MCFVFLASYVLRLIAYTYGRIEGNWTVLDSLTNSVLSGWYKVVLIANSLFSIGMMLSFINLSTFVQFNDTLGPLQLALYHLILDVMKFLLFFSFFFVAFGISLKKLYWHYTSTQKHVAKTEERSTNGTGTETDHTFSR